MAEHAVLAQTLGAQPLDELLIEDVGDQRPHGARNHPHGDDRHGYRRQDDVAQMRGVGPPLLEPSGPAPVGGSQLRSTEKMMTSTMPSQ